MANVAYRTVTRAYGHFEVLVAEYLLLNLVNLK